MDNASGHSGDDVVKVARELRKRLRFFPPNATDLVQPADRFPIQRIKAHWRHLCEQRNIQAIQRGEWRHGSGSRLNPGKKFFLQTAAECMRRVNAECDKTGANRAKTSMVHCGLDVGADGVWKVEQLGKDLQEIIAEYPDEFRKGI
ncbi:hypothetical protein PC128_g17012 [Phytophthora cactorum]|nr:hypothetical protein PC128_g17012 [Phytophthora cactorum]